MEIFEKPEFDTDRKSSDEELLRVYEHELNLMSLFSADNESKIQDFVKASGLTMERKIGENGKLETVKLTDEDGKLVWFMDFEWYRKNQEKDLENAKKNRARSGVN